MNILEELRSLDMNDPGRWPLPIRIGAVTIILVACAALGIWQFVVKTEIPDLELAEREELELRANFERKQSRAVNLEAYEQQLETIQRDFGTMLLKLPGQTEVENLLEDISRTALSVGLEYNVFDPQSETQREFYAEKPIQLQYEGTYHEIGTFISEVAALNRIVTLHDVQIRPLSTDGESENLQFTATAKTYRYLDEEAG